AVHDALRPLDRRDAERPDGRGGALDRAERARGSPRPLGARRRLMEGARDSVEVATDRWGLFEEVIPQVTLRTAAPAGPMRLGLWAFEDRVAGWWLPGLPPDSMLVIEGTTATGFVNGDRRVLRNFLRGWD